MNILAVDDEKLSLNAMQTALEKAIPTGTFFLYRTADEALACAEETQIDIAFLDIEMRGMNGLELAKRLKELQGKMNVIFVTGYSEYAIDAFQLYVSGYLLKPVSADKLTEAVRHLRNPVQTQNKGKLHVQCFGNFEVFVDGKPLEFSRQKSKGLLAYLVDRCGAASTVAEIAAVLWEDGQYNISRKNQIHNYVSDLKKTLQAVGMEAVLIRQYNSYAVNVDLIDCDLYHCMNGDVAAINRYCGEYMAQYSWAEFTAGMLTQKLI